MIATITTYPLLLVLFMAIVAGLFFAIRELYFSYKRKETPSLVLLILVSLMLIHIVLYVIRAPFYPRHEREFYTVGSLFAAIFFVQFSQTFSKKLGVLALLSIVTLGLIQEFSAMGKYERLIYTDWHYSTFYDWTVNNIPGNAVILTDPFTLYAVISAAPMAQTPKVNEKIRAQFGSAFDPIMAIFSGKMVREGLLTLCPDYVVIDRANTQQFYPVELQDKPERFGELLTLIYNTHTSKSQITVFKSKVVDCTPLI